MYCNIGKLEFEVEKISLVPNHIGEEIKSSLPKTYDGRAFGYILWLGWDFVNKKHLAIASHAANDSRCSLKNYSTLFLKFKYYLGGAWGIQTPDLGNANAALYQLS